MKRLVWATLIIIALAAAGLMLLPSLVGTAKIVAPDSLKPAPESIPRVEAGSYLPDGLTGIRMGMSLEHFRGTEHAKDASEKDFDFRITTTKRYQGKAFSEATFYFDNDGDHPLYEVIVEYPSEYDLPRHLAEKHGDPTHEGEWRYRDHDDYYIMIWTFINKVVIAANMKGTEHQSKK
ncbi:hypothetical protein [Luteolibacter luteus]|uniref:Uncharacterized protein n=1 Tax=Luteolibacter luteus TaxID=2728835 RepID=A0A858RES9_9BACT|nr:hypothetical protein [Luteolibacter luteus]QJE95596.1 hypothetical protein HHL09_07275 [Luteolibacter luteus]